MVPSCPIDDGSLSTLLLRHGQGLRIQPDWLMMRPSLSRNDPPAAFSARGKWETSPLGSNLVGLLERWALNRIFCNLPGLRAGVAINSLARRVGGSRLGSAFSSPCAKDKWADARLKPGFQTGKTRQSWNLICCLPPGPQGDLLTPTLTCRATHLGPIVRRDTIAAILACINTAKRSTPGQLW
jgi:hypothetical protein